MTGCHWRSGRGRRGALLKGLASQAKESRLYPVRGGRPLKDFSDKNRCVCYEAKPVEEGHRGGEITKVGEDLGGGEVQK